MLTLRSPDAHRDDLVILEAGHPREVAAEEGADLAHRGFEQLARRNVLRHERRHTPQRRLLLGQTLELPLGLAALGHVARHSVHEPVSDHRRRRPFEHPLRAVLADVAVLERQRPLALTDGGGLRRRALTVVRMDQVEVGPRKKLFLRVAEHLLDRWIHAREVSVEVGDGDQIGREREDAVELLLRPGSPPRADAERRRQTGEEEAGGEDEPRQDSRGALDRLLRHHDLESLACDRERLAGGFRAAVRRSAAGRDLRRSVRPWPLRAASRPTRRPPRTPSAEPLRSGSGPAPRGRARCVPVRGGATGVAATPVKAGRPGECGGHPGYAAQIGAGRGHGRKAGDQRRRQVGRARSGGDDLVALVGRHDWLAETPFVRRTP